MISQPRLPRPSRSAPPRVRLPSRSRTSGPPPRTAAAGTGRHPPVASIALPYWSITLRAPQYPRGSRSTSSSTRWRAERARGRWAQPLHRHDQADRRGGNRAVDLPRSTSRSSPSSRSPRSGFVGAGSCIARLPIVIYPIVFVADLYAWLYYAGHSSTPTRRSAAPSRSSPPASSAPATSSSSAPKPHSATASISPSPPPRSFSSPPSSAGANHDARA